MSDNKFQIKEPLGPMLTRASRAVSNMLQQMFLESGQNLTADEWAILANLTMLKDGQFQQQLADRTCKDKAAMTRLIDGLEKRGLAKRVPDEKDRRQKRIFLTQKSRDLMQVLFPVAKKAQLKVQQGVTAEELDLFKLVLRKIFINTGEAE
jgi:DNA-binding MarR family transcriptional regulator